MKKTIRNTVFFLLTAILPAAAFAQYNGAVLRLEKNSIRIGDQIQAELSVTLPAGSQVKWPMLYDTLTAHVEILRKTDIDTVESNKTRFTLKQEFTVTSFDSGYYRINPILVRYNQPGDTVTFFTETSPATLEVQTIQVDPAKDIKPIKPPLRAPVTFREIWPWILLALGVIAIAIAIWYILKRRKNRPKPVATTRLDASKPPYEAAIDALENLKNKRLWQAGLVKEYYSELTDIVREYIELRFMVRALEMTTAEISDAMRLTDAAVSTRDKLIQTLTLADLVKFAKEQPLPVDNELSLNRCFEFVRETKPPKDAESLNAQPADSVEPKQLA